MDDGDFGQAGPDDFSTPFIFVPHGDPPPLEWMAAHPGWVKFPAVMVLRAEPPALSPPAYSQPGQRASASFPGGTPCDVSRSERQPSEGDPSDGAPASFVGSYNFASRSIGAPTLAQPVSEPPEVWENLGGALSHILGIPRALAQTPEESVPNEDPEGRGEENLDVLPPLQRLLAYRRAWEDLRRIEPGNPTLANLARPKAIIPDQKALDRLTEELARATARQQARLQVDRARPEGFPDQASLQRFASYLAHQLAASGMKDFRIGLAGSSVTGFSFSTGEAFRPESDLDVFVISPELLRRAKDSGVNLRSGEIRTRPLESTTEMRKIGLPESTVAALRRLAGGRRVSIMVYRDLNAVLARESPYMIVDE